MSSARQASRLSIPQQAHLLLSEAGLSDKFMN